MKVSVIGAGNVGATTALLLAQAGFEEIALVDIVENVAEGKTLDLKEAAPLQGFTTKINGSTGYEVIDNSDVVVVTAGSPRKPGMSREDLLEINKKVVSSVSEQIKQHAPSSIIIMVTNPLDLMAFVAMKVTGFPRERVIGMAGMLDTARFRYFLADALNVSPEKIEAMVLGSHGDSMVPLLSQTTADGKPVAEFLEKEKLDAIIERTRKGGAEIVVLLKTGSAFYAPAASVVEMVKAIESDSDIALPCSAFLQNEYGLSDLFIGVPCKLGKQGLREVVELPLSKQEKQELNSSAEAIKKGIEDLGL